MHSPKFWRLFLILSVAALASQPFVRAAQGDNLPTNLQGDYAYTSITYQISAAGQSASGSVPYSSIQSIGITFTVGPKGLGGPATAGNVKQVQAYVAQIIKQLQSQGIGVVKITSKNLKILKASPTQFAAAVSGNFNVQASGVVARVTISPGSTFTGVLKSNGIITVQIKLSGTISAKGQRANYRIMVTGTLAHL